MSRLLAVLFFIALASFAQADRTVQGSLVTTNNIAIAGSADGTVTINLGLSGAPPTLLVTSSGATTLTINAVASGSLGLALPSGEGIATLGLGTYAGLDISSSNSSATLTLQLQTPSLTALFTANTQVAGIFYASGSAYVNIPSTYASGILTAQLPGVGSYVFVSITKTVSADYSVPRAVIAGANRTYQWASNFAIQFSSQASNTIDVIASNTTTSGTAAARAAIGIELGVYFSIELGASAAAHSSIIQYTYTDAQLVAKGIAATAAAGLKWAYYDTVSTTWKLAEQASSVDVNAKVVAQATTHFSEWGVFYAGSSASTLLLSVTVYLIVAVFLML